MTEDERVLGNYLGKILEKVRNTKDFNECNELIGFLVTVKETLSDEKIVQLFEKRILAENNPYVSCIFASKVNGTMIKKHEQIVLESNNSDCCYYFAKNVKGSDAKKLGDVISNNANSIEPSTCNLDDLDDDFMPSDMQPFRLCYEFARDIEGADVKALGDTLIEAKRRFSKSCFNAYNLNVDGHLSDLCYYFARDVEGADINSLSQIIVEYGGTDLCYDFAKNVEGADVASLQQVILNSFDFNRYYYFAKDIKGANVKALLNKLISSKCWVNTVCNERYDYSYGYEWLCYLFAVTFPEVVDKKLLEEEVRTGKNPAAFYLFARDIEGADVKKLSDYFGYLLDDKYGYWHIKREYPPLEERDAKLCYLFARDIKNIDIEPLQKLILNKSGNAEIMFRFAQDVEGADLWRIYSEIFDEQSPYKDEISKEKSDEVEEVKEVYLLAKEFGNSRYYVNQLKDKYGYYYITMNDIIEIINKSKEGFKLVSEFYKDMTLKDYILLGRRKCLELESEALSLKQDGLKQESEIEKEKKYIYS